MSDLLGFPSSLNCFRGDFWQVNIDFGGANNMLEGLVFLILTSFIFSGMKNGSGSAGTRDSYKCISLH